MQTKFIAAALFAASAYGANVARQDLGDIVTSVVQGEVSSVVNEATSRIGSLTSGIPSNWAEATSKIANIDDRIESKYSSVTGWNSISSDLHNAIASGTGGVAAFFSTQTAVASSVAASIKSDADAAIISAVATSTASATGGATPSASGNAAPRMMVGSVMGVVGVIAGVAML